MAPISKSSTIAVPFHVLPVVYQNVAGVVFGALDFRYKGAVREQVHRP
jgi:hypothetical protein